MREGVYTEEHIIVFMVSSLFIATILVEINKLNTLG